MKNEIKSIFMDVEIVTVPNAGHWVHAENPKRICGESWNFSSTKQKKSPKQFGDFLDLNIIERPLYFWLKAEQELSQMNIRRVLRYNSFGPEGNAVVAKDACVRVYKVTARLHL